MALLPCPLSLSFAPRPPPPFSFPLPSPLARRPSLLIVRMGGGPRTYPGGVTKWQWKRMQVKKAKQLLKARLCRERQIYEMRKRSELKAAVSQLERPWEPVDRPPNLFSVAADEQLKVLADRFQRPGGFDMWTDRDGPQVFTTPGEGVPSARFFPKGAVHSVRAYGVLGVEERERRCLGGGDDDDDDDYDGEVIDVEVEGLEKRDGGRCLMNLPSEGRRGNGVLEEVKNGGSGRVNSFRRLVKGMRSGFKGRDGLKGRREGGEGLSGGSSGSRYSDLGRVDMDQNEDEDWSTNGSGRRKDRTRREFGNGSDLDHFDGAEEQISGSFSRRHSGNRWELWGGYSSNTVDETGEWSAGGSGTQQNRTRKEFSVQSDLDPFDRIEQSSGSFSRRYNGNRQQVGGSYDSNNLDEADDWSTHGSGGHQNGRREFRNRLNLNHVDETEELASGSFSRKYNGNRREGGRYGSNNVDEAEERSTRGSGRHQNGTRRKFRDQSKLNQADDKFVTSLNSECRGTRREFRDNRSSSKNFSRTQMQSIGSTRNHHGGTRQGSRNNYALNHDHGTEEQFIGSSRFRHQSGTRQHFRDQSASNSANEVDNWPVDGARGRGSGTRRDFRNRFGSNDHNVGASGEAEDNLITNRKRLTGGNGKFRAGKITLRPSSKLLIKKNGRERRESSALQDDYAFE